MSLGSVNIIRSISTATVFIVSRSATHNEQQEALCQWGVASCGYKAGQCFIAKLPTNPISPIASPPPFRSNPFLITRQKRNKILSGTMNGAFLHDGPITAGEGGCQFTIGKERTKECVRMNGPLAKCGKLGH